MADDSREIGLNSGDFQQLMDGLAAFDYPHALMWLMLYLDLVILIGDFAGQGYHWLNEERLNRTYIQSRLIIERLIERPDLTKLVSEPLYFVLSLQGSSSMEEFHDDWDESIKPQYLDLRERAEVERIRIGYVYTEENIAHITHVRSMVEGEIEEGRRLLDELAQKAYAQDPWSNPPPAQKSDTASPFEPQTTLTPVSVLATEFRLTANGLEYKGKVIHAASQGWKKYSFVRELFENKRVEKGGMVAKGKPLTAAELKKASGFAYVQPEINDLRNAIASSHLEVIRLVDAAVKGTQAKTYQLHLFD